jgi:hypothetical protein
MLTLAEKAAAVFRYAEVEIQVTSSLEKDVENGWNGVYALRPQLWNEVDDDGAPKSTNVAKLDHPK